MTNKLAIAAAVASVLCSGIAAWPSSAEADTTIHVAYSYPSTWQPIQTALAAAFEKEHPDIHIEFLAPYTDYEDATQKVLRGAATGDVPDLVWIGLNRQRVFVDKGIAVDLTPFTSKEADWEKRGYTGAMMDLGRIDGKVYGIATGISTAVIYYNGDLVRQAGGDPNNFPKTWDGVIALGGKIKALGNNSGGMFIDWDGTGNWLFQNLVFAAGGTMTTSDEKNVAFNDPAGLWAVNTLSQMMTEGGMPNISGTAAIEAFLAGKLGMYIDSVADVPDYEANVGKRFDLRTAPFPLTSAKGRLAAGGAAGMMLAKDPAAQAAAWEYLKFAGSSEGSAIVAQTSGYMPPNILAATEHLTDFYKAHQNQYVSIQQLPYVTGWYAFPGPNGLKIFDVIKGHLGDVVSGTAKPADALAAMATDVQVLLPKN
jgi:multiple sugar transport system substrate-binding protein